MTEPYIGEIQLFAFSFPPRGWAFCNGALVSIASNTALFSILGVTYGGNGTTTFALPNLQGRAAIGAGTGPGRTTQSLGQTGGQPGVTLTSNQIPAHTHVLNAGQLSAPNPVQNVATPATNALPGLSAPNNVYIAPVTPNTSMVASSISTTGGSQAHENMQPFLAINFCIATTGIFPARN